MTAERLLRLLRSAARRKHLPKLADFTAPRGEAFETAYSALEMTDYYISPVDDTPKRRRKCIDAALAALKAGE